MLQAGAAKSERIHVTEHSPYHLAACAAFQVRRRLKCVITQVRLLIVIQHRSIWQLPEYLLPRAGMLLRLQVSSSLLILENGPRSHGWLSLSSW
jgi:hypothetical protein